MKMNWDELEDVLFDGTPEQIEAAKCPECDGELKLKYFPATRNMEIKCKKCGATVRSHGVSYTPNFANLSDVAQSTPVPARTPA